MSSMYDEIKRDIEFAQYARKRIPVLAAQVARLRAAVEDEAKFLLELSVAMTISGNVVTANGIANHVTALHAALAGGARP